MWIGCDGCQAGVEHCGDCAIGYLLASKTVESSTARAGSSGRCAAADPVWLAQVTARAGADDLPPSGSVRAGGGAKSGWLRAVVTGRTGRESERWVSADADELAALDCLAAAGIVSPAQYTYGELGRPTSLDRLAG